MEHLSLYELKDILLKKYTRKYLADKLEISEQQLYRILNRKNNMTLIQYEKLLTLI